MKIRELIEILQDCCDQDADVVNADYEDIYVVKEETTHGFRNGTKHSTKHIILEFEKAF
jgi:hypothetical protein